MEGNLGQLTFGVRYMAGKHSLNSAR